MGNLIRFGTYSVALALLVIVSGCSKKEITIKKSKHTSKAWHKASMKSYKVRGKRYYPETVDEEQTMKGISSWYGPKFHNKKTSNGERYNMYAFTAAHKTWPMDTVVKVSNLQNGKSTIVRINDRGPFVKGRIIDCSYAAGKKIGLDKMGIANVKIEVLNCTGNMESSKKIDPPYKQREAKRKSFSKQLVALKNLDSAKKFRNEYINTHKDADVSVVHVAKGNEVIYRVLLNGFKSEEAVNNFNISTII